MNARQLAKAVMEDDEDPKEFAQRVLPTLEKYMVVTMNPQDSQVFWDYIMAVNPQEAERKVCEVRDYADTVAVLDVDEMNDIAKRFAAISPAEIFRQWKVIKSHH